MAIDMSTDGASRRKATSKTSIEYHLILLLSFCVFLVATTVERLLPWTWMRRGERRPSIVAKAWGAAETCTTYAFMG